MFTGVYTSYRNFGSSDPFALKLTSYNKDRPEVLHIYLHAKRPTQSCMAYLKHTARFSAIGISVEVLRGHISNRYYKGKSGYPKKTMLQVHAI